jgi:hypothetical protein
MELWGRGTTGPNLPTTLLRPEPYILNFPLHSGIATLTYHVLCKKYTETEILS